MNATLRVRYALLLYTVHGESCEILELALYRVAREN